MGNGVLRDLDHRNKKYAFCCPGADRLVTRQRHIQSSSSECYLIFEKTSCNSSSSLFILPMLIFTAVLIERCITIQMSCPRLCWNPQVDTLSRSPLVCGHRDFLFICPFPLREALWCHIAIGLDWDSRDHRLFNSVQCTTEWCSTRARYIKWNKHKMRDALLSCYEEHGLRTSKCVFLVWCQSLVFCKWL